MRRRQFFQTLMTAGVLFRNGDGRASDFDRDLGGGKGVSLRAFGAVGDGVADDTPAIQHALSSGETFLIAEAKSEFLVDGGLICRTPGLILRADGATFKLRPHAQTLGMLTLFGHGSTVIGGTWDGNKAGDNRVGSAYDSFNIRLNANDCTVTSIRSVNTYGMAIKGGETCSGLLVKDCQISDVELYGIFIDSNGTANQLGNRAIGNSIDCSAGGESGQGILFTSKKGSQFLQTGWEVSRNRVIAFSEATGPQAICIAVRGANGRFEQNETRFGSMGISEGGDKTVFLHNVISDLRGAAYGIEPSGAGCVIDGNKIRSSRFGIICSGEQTKFDGLDVLNNDIESSEACVYLQIGRHGSATDISLHSNALRSRKHGVRTRSGVLGLRVEANELIGPDSAHSSRAVYLEDPGEGSKVAVVGNKLSGFERNFVVFSREPRRFRTLTSDDNSDVVGEAAVVGWQGEGRADLGSSQ